MLSDLHCILSSTILKNADFSGFFGICQKNNVEKVLLKLHL